MSVQRSPEQQFAFAKGLPISELTKVLQGQSDVVDMSIAQMVLRDKTRSDKIQRGLMAQQAVAQTPKVVDKDLMEAGIGSLPGDLDTDYADGGIVAFAAGDAVGPTMGSTVRPGAGPTFASAFPNYTPPKTPGFMDFLKGGARTVLGRVLPALEATKSLDTNVGEQEYLDTLRALRQLGYTDEAIETMPAAMREQLVTGQAIHSGKALETPKMGPLAEAPVVDDAADTAQAAALSGVARELSQRRGLLGARPDLAKSSRELDEMYKQAGVSMDPYADYKKDLKAEAGKDAEARKEAGWMRAFEAGLGIMGGESPYAFVNIGKGAKDAVKGYAEDIKEFRKADKDRTRALADIAAAENSLKKGVTDAKLQRFDRAVEKYDATNLKLFELESTINLTKAKMQVDKGGRVQEVALKEANDQMQKELVLNPGLAQDPTLYQNRLNELYTTFVSALSGKGAVSSGALPGGVKVTPKK